jgi:hypothetical protein
MKNKKNGGEGVCLVLFQTIVCNINFGVHIFLPHIIPHIKIGVTDGVSQSDLDLIIGGGVWNGRACVSDGRFT